MFNKLQVGWKDLKDYLGFLFGWDDIVNTKETIKLILNGFLSFGEADVGQLETNVNRSVQTLFTIS